MIPNPALGTESPPAQRARRLDRLCDRFEAAWKAGRRPSLKRYLSKVPPEAQPNLFRELLVLELEYRTRKGDPPEREEYHRDFPEHAEQIDTVFAEVTPAGSASASLLRRWTANRLANELRMLLFPDGASAPSGEGGAQDGTPSVLGSSLSPLFALLARLLGGGGPEVSLADASGSKTLNPTGQQGEGSPPEADGSGPNASPTQLLPSENPANGSLSGMESAAGTVLGDYELLELVGKGGMGVVYKARQRSTNRIVALKVIRSDRLEDRSPEECREWFERFRREAQIAASLEHDNLVTVYERGQAGGRYFYSMRFVDGQSLAEILRTGPLPNARAAFYLEQIARVLHVLHTQPQRIVHRDLKPKNILVDRHDRPYVTDFGLAKWTAYSPGLTVMNSCMGTAEYISPEQSRNSESAGPASDIYSLGATFYELLTGRPPFRAADPVETLRQVQEEEPLSPRQLNPAVHRDLELICLKCLQKEPHKRYANALELAEELRRYRTGEPLRHTRAVTKAERIWRWCRRKPALAATGSLAVVALLTATIVSVSFALYWAAAVREKQLELAKSALNNGLAKCAEGKVSEGMLWLARCLNKAPDDERDLNRVARLNLASWYSLLAPLRQILPHENEVIAVAFSKDGRLILTATKNMAQLWDAATGKPNGPAIPVPGYVKAAALSPDGSIILTESLDKNARLWEASTGRLIRVIPNYATTQELTDVTAVAFGPEGKVFITGGKDGTARLWDAGTGKPIGMPLQHKGPVGSVAFSSDGKTAMTATETLGKVQGEARFWEVATGRPISILPLEGPNRALAYSPDAKAILVVNQATNAAKLWDVPTHKWIEPPIQLQAGVNTVAFSPDGKTILAGSSDGVAQLWDVKSGRRVGPPLFHDDGIRCAAFAPDGKHFITGGADKTARFWQAGPNQSLPLQHEKDHIQAAAFSQDGTMAATGSEEGNIELWEIATGKHRSFTDRHAGIIRGIAFSPDGKTLLTGSTDRTAILWDVASGTPRAVLKHDLGVFRVAFSPDGKTVLTASLDENVRLWDAATGKSIGLLPHTGIVHSMAFSPDGTMIVAGCHDGTAQIWYAGTGLPGPTLKKQPDDVLKVEFSPDVKYVLTGCADGNAQLWDARTGNRIGPPLKHPAPVYLVAFSPDGSLILTGSGKQARLWEAVTGLLRGVPMQHQDAVRSMAFSPDGRLVLTGSEDKTARFWDATTGRPCGPPLQHQGPVSSVLFTPDGKMALTAGYDKAVRLGTVPVPVEGLVERIVLWTKVITGMELDSTDTVVVMDSQKWHNYVDQLEQLGGPPIP